jgi:LuxR family maltose regulon positive regulatory protein
MLGRAVESRRLLQLAERARSENPERYSSYVDAVAGIVRAAAVDAHVGEAVETGRRAVELAAAGHDGVLVAALASYARALYYAGRPDTAWAAALRAVEHPEAARRAPGHAFARSTLALIALDRGQPATARIHSCAARALVSTAGLSRSWLGAHVAAAYGLVLAAEGDSAGAERELAYAQHFLGDEVATVHHAWLQVALARVRCARGRLAAADAALDAVRATVRELADCGDVPSLADAVEAQLRVAHERARAGAMVEVPSPAERTVLRRLDSELSVRQIAAELFLSVNTVRSHTRSLYRKLGVSSRTDAVARARELGLLGRSDSPR